ncbi:hypothetical protein MBLNU459_g8320t2 [Dothideomycetes sp. NU459]
MAPGAGKRKRDSRTFPHDDTTGRPAPHRPENMHLARSNQNLNQAYTQDQRRDSRGGGAGGAAAAAASERGGAGGGDRGSDRRRYNNHNHNYNNPYHSHNRGGGYANHADRQHAGGMNTTPAHPRPPPPPTPQPMAAPASTPAPSSPFVRAPPQLQPQPQPQPSPSPAPPARSAPAPSAMPSSPPGPPTPYTYDYLTDGVVSSWHQSGRQAVLDAFAQADGPGLTSGVILQELLRATLDGRLAPSDSGAALEAILAQQTDQAKLELQSLFADTLAVLDEKDWRNPSLKSLIAAAGIPPDMLRDQLDIETLSALGLVRSTFSTIRNRKTTNLIYRQANFNLLREESEGYSKLITEYFNAANFGSISDTLAEDSFQRIKALVGSFDLDVGRVLDITLDVMANLLVKNFRFFVKYLRASSWWPEEDIPEAINWTGQQFGALPSWALPGSGAWNQTTEERERLAALTRVRDLEFWQRVRESGTNAFFDIGTRKITNFDSAAVRDLLDSEVQPERDSRGKETNTIRKQRTNNARKWMKETGCLPPPGNADAAQLLGFKLAFYASSIRDKTDTMPDNLIYLAALLIKIGFISLRDLYPHLYPADEKMDDYKDKLKKEKEERERAARPGGGALNALAMAGALADDSLPVPAVRALRDTASGRASPRPDGADRSASVPAVAEEEKEQLPEPENQKALLLKALLAIGALPEALYILGKFPWLADLVPELPDYIHRIIHHMLAKVYEPARPLADRVGLSDPKDHIGDPAGLPKGQLRFVSPPTKKALRWANLDRPDHGEGTEYRFYWDEWSDNIPICQTVDDVFQLCSTFLNFTGVKIGRDSTLLMKLARIGKMSLTEDPSPANTARWVDLCKRILVPALSLTKRNTGDVNEMFELLKYFPTSTRYAIYAEWHQGAISRLPDIEAAFNLTKAETKDVLKRISKTNVRAMGKALSKVAFSSPGVVMQVAIHQMESYDNLIDVVVECVRYFSMLGYDVLVWCLMNALGGGNRNRVQADGMLTSAWLRALSSFAGSIFKRYSAIDASPILQYVANELRNGNSTDLEVLEQIITGMAGIRSDITLNESQVLAMAGGPIMQAQTLIALHDERHKMEKSSRRLIKALTEPGLAGQLLISIAQERQMYANHESSKHAPLKVLGSNLDKIHEVFAQYLDTLRSNLAAKDFDAAVPDVVSLMSDYGLEPGLAFMISRASISHTIIEMDATRKLEGKARRVSQDKSAINGDVNMTDSDERLNELITEANTTQVKRESSVINGIGVKPALSLSETDAEMREVLKANGVATPTPTPAPLASPSSESSTAFWHPALTPTIEKLRKVWGEELESTLNIPFYVTFWTLSLEDILVNTASYDQELAVQTHHINQINSDRSDMSVKASKERELKKKAIVDLKERLTHEMKTQIGAYTQVRNRLNKEKDHWFSEFGGKNPEILHSSILQNCFLPRSLLSPLDAHYTFMMLKFLHNNGAPGFRTMHLLDRLLRKNQITNIMFQCTSREAENFGRFLNEVLKEMQTWHSDKATYEKNAFGPKRQLPGFARKLTADGTPETFLEFEDYRRLLWKWHGYLNGAILACFDSGEYMHIRNAIIILKGVHQHFPAVSFMGTNMFDKVTSLSKSETRADLKLAATSLLGDLKRREKFWMMPQAFRLGDGLPNGQKVEPSRPGTPASSNTTPLNATAPNFKPVGAAVPAAQHGESEDGEIDDGPASIEPETGADTASTQGGMPAATEVALQSKPNMSGPARAFETETRTQNLTPAMTRAHTPSERSDSQPPTIQSTARMPHTLPNKPDNRSSARASNDRPENRRQPPRFDPRERVALPPQEFGRLDRPSEARTPGAGVSREPSPGRRSHQRTTPERDQRDYHGARPEDRQDTRPPQDVRTFDRDASYGPPRRDGRESIASNRFGDGRNYADGPTSMPPPLQQEPRVYGRPDRNGPPPMSRPPFQGPPISGQHGSVAVNPDRLARITGNTGNLGPGNGDRRDSSKPDRDDRQDRGSRPHSPRREDDSGSLQDGGRGGRTPLDPNPFHSQGDRRDGLPRRDEPSEHAPTGPRSGRPGRNDSLPRPGPRDLFEQSAPSRRPVESNHGRLSQDAEPIYGRLNANSDPPSGPRSFNGPFQHGGSRNFAHSSQPTANIRSTESQMLQPPSSPPGSRLPPRGPHGERQFGAASATPSTPASAQQLPNMPGVHPTRMPHLQTDTVQNASTPPSGPRNLPGPSVSTPNGPSPAAKFTHSGPPSTSASSDRRGGANDRRFAGLNEALQGGNNNERGTSIRGHARRQNSTAGQPLPTPPNQQPQHMIPPPSHEPFNRTMPPNGPLDQRHPSERRHDSGHHRAEHGHDDRRAPNAPEMPSHEDYHRGAGSESGSDNRRRDHRDRSGNSNGYVHRDRRSGNSDGRPSRDESGMRPQGQPRPGGGQAPSYGSNEPNQPPVQVRGPLPSQEEYVRRESGAGRGRDPRDEGWGSGRGGAHVDNRGGGTSGASGADGRKRRGDEMQPGDSKRRRSGM